MIHKLENNYIAEVIPQELRVLSFTSGPQYGGLALAGGALRAFGIDGQRGLIIRNP